MDNTQINELIIFFVLTLFVLVITLFSLFYIFNSRRLKFIIERKETHEKFSKELESSRLESQEHLLKTLSWELHDNIGQLLSVSKMQLSMISSNLSPEDQKIITDTRDLLSKVLEDVRSLSKSLNAESLVFLGLAKAIHLEIERLNRLGFVKATFEYDENIPELHSEHEVILFRIVQECISNVIKHARANTFNVSLNMDANNLIIETRDDGIGMPEKSDHFGLGLKNIISRAKMLKADVIWESPSGGGLLTKITYPVT